MKLKFGSRRGHSLLTVTISMALATGASLAVLDMLQEDKLDQGLHNRGSEAREAAEAGFMEFVNDREVMQLLPTLSTSQLKNRITASPGSRFSGTKRRGESGFSGDIKLVRVVPVRESSQSLVRAVVYEASIDGESTGQASSHLDAEVYRMTVNQMGRVAPRVHAR